MLKNRLIACLIIREGIVVQSIGFEKYLPVGRPEVSVEFLNAWGIDEIVMLDIDATPAGHSPDADRITRVSAKCYVPLTVGGGIRNVEDVHTIIHGGADKVVINTAALENPELIAEASGAYGDQCIVISMDIRQVDGAYQVFAASGQKATGLSPVDWARRAEALGAGEILLNSIDRDGSKQGYDIALIAAVTESVSIPVIACGGVGHPRHFVDGFEKGGASACAAANYFHFTEHSPITSKAFLATHNVDIRLDSYARYDDCAFIESGRIAKRADDILDHLKFQYQAEEII